MKVGKYHRANLFVFVVMFLVVAASAQTTSFTYQGSLQNTGVPANGTYDFEFAIFNAVAAGSQLGSTQTVNGVVITNGAFTVTLNFGDQFPGANRFLEIRVRASGGGVFTTLAPRQQILSSPYSVKSLSADTAANASTAVSATTASNALQLGGVAANQYVLTTDARMSDARSPLAGSANYVQNQNSSPQASSNFNISGTGTANIFAATTQFNIGANRILGNAGSANLFAGVGSGAANTGDSNSFFGNLAGNSNTTGRLNSMFGSGAGQFNTTGIENSFFGLSAGLNVTTGNSNALFGAFAGNNITTADSNSFFGRTSGAVNTTGVENSFFGRSAGFNNLSGNGNSFFGRNAGLSNSTGSNNTIVGANADVGANNLTNATAIGSGATVSASNTIALGRSNGSDTVVVPGNLNVSGTVSGTFNGTAATATNALNLGGVAAAQYVQTSDPRLSDARQPLAGNSNYVQNRSTVQTATNFNISGVGSASVFNAATQFNLSGARILGVGGGTANTFGGINAGANASNLAENNTFFGDSAGQNMVTAGGNSFFGAAAGQNTTSGGSNTLVGFQSGKANTTGDSNAFFGSQAGTANTTGDNNAFFGRNAGAANITGSGNSFFGYQAGMSNTTSNNSFFGFTAGKLTTGINNSFFGWSSGAANTTGTNNAFFGVQSGLSNQSGADNVFFGRDAGRDNISGNGNAFFGRNSGLLTRSDNNTFIGLNAGNTNFAGSSNTVIGANADVASAALDFATAIGAGAVVDTSNTVLLGRATDSVVAAGNFKAKKDLSVDLDLRVQSNIYLTDPPLNGNITLCRDSFPDGSILIARCVSSIRFKQNVENYSPGLSLIKQLRPVSFNWKRNGAPDLGFVAEEVASVEPLLTTTGKNGEVEGVKYDRISAVLVNAIKDQQIQIEKQAAANTELKALVDKQQVQIAALSRIVRTHLRSQISRKTRKGVRR